MRFQGVTPLHHCSLPFSIVEFRTLGCTGSIDGLKVEVTYSADPRIPSRCLARISTVVRAEVLL